MPTARFNTLWNSNETRLRRLTAETESFRAGQPFDPLQYVALVNRVNTYPAVTLWNLTLPEFSQLVGGPLQLAKRSQYQARLMEPVNAARAEDLVNKTKVMLLALDALVQGTSMVQATSRATGLGVAPLVVGTGAAVSFSVAAVLVVGLLVAASAVASATSGAAVYCVAAGCSIPELQTVVGAMTDAAVRILETNPVNKVVNPAGPAFGDLIFWGGLLAVGSAVAYGIWKAEGAPIPGRVARALNGLSEGFEPDTARLKDQIRKGPREDQYIDTSEYDALVENEGRPAKEPVAVAAKAGAPTRRSTAGEGRLVASYPLRKGVRPAADMDMAAWKIACRALGMKTSEGAGCTKPEMVVDEVCTQARKIVFGQDLSPSDMDKVARALRGGGYKVEIS